MTGRPSVRSTAARSVLEVIDLYERFGANRYDEDVTQLDHGLQAMALAIAATADEPIVAAALLHDVGHLLMLRDHGAGRSEDDRHEVTGAAWLRPLFPRKVTRPIALHVAAKRYLCAVDPGYAARLSQGSIRSLARQGGPMSPAQVRRFEATPQSDAAVQLRRWDDAAKVVGAAVAPLDDRVERLCALARAR